MPSSQQMLWSNYPDAPKISHHLYIEEKAYFVGVLTGPILYGFLVVLFFKCMTTLFDPVHHRGDRTKWGLVSYTMFMFLVATALTGIGFDIQSDSYINNREFPGVPGDVLPPGPLGYQSFTFSDALTIVSNPMFFLNGWLADGLLLYRCYIIYSTKLRFIAVPSLMYLGSLGKYSNPHKLTMTVRANVINTATGILYQVAGLRDVSYGSAVTDFGLPYISISISLNILLTLMIIIRLILHTKNIRTAMGGTGINGLCTAIVTILVESCALYTMSSLFVIAPWVAGYHDVIILLPILSQTQVIAPLLIIKRVADKSALTKNTIVSGRLSSFKTGAGGEVTGSSGTLSGGGPVSSVDGHGMPGSSEHGAGAGATIDLHPSG